MTLDLNLDATAHASADGSSHTFIDQDVTSGSSPTFDGTNFTNLPSSGGAWADYPNMVQVTLAEQADSISTPPAGFAWDNDVGHSSSIDGSGVWSVDHDATSTGVTTGPRCTKTVAPVPGKRRAVAAFVSTADGDANHEGVGILMTENATTNYHLAGIQFTSGQERAFAYANGGYNGPVNGDIIAGGSMAAGVWILLWEEFLGSTPARGAAYALGGDRDAPPSDDEWVVIGDQAYATGGGGPLDSLEIGPWVKSGNVSNTMTGKIEALWIGEI